MFPLWCGLAESLNFITITSAQNACCSWMQAHWALLREILIRKCFLIQYCGKLGGPLLAKVA